jgi:transposase
VSCELPRAQQFKVDALIAVGASLRKIARDLGCSKSTVIRYKRLLSAGYDVDMETRHMVPACMAPVRLPRVLSSSDQQELADRLELVGLIEAQRRDARRWQIQYGPSLDRPLRSGQSLHDVVAAE